VEIGSIPARFLVRKNMGERAFSILAFIFCLVFYGLIGLAAFVLMNQFLGNELSDPKWIDWQTFWRWCLILLVNPFSIFIVWIMAKGVSHFKVIVKRILAKIVGYSYHRGDSIHHDHWLGTTIFAFNLDDESIRMFIEPLHVFAWGIAMFSISISLFLFRINMEVLESIPFIVDNTLVGFTTVRLCCMISALFLMLEEFVLRSRFRASSLDLIDGDIEMMRILKAKNQLQLEERFILPTENQSSDSLVVG
ncbi:MAG: hypothetical protein AAFO82_14050, partial [Bacteroidota bacterium]